eukprot:4280355-Prymnesium_polylepis.1
MASSVAMRAAARAARRAEAAARRLAARAESRASCSRRRGTRRTQSAASQHSMSDGAAAGCRRRPRELARAPIVVPLLQYVYLDRGRRWQTKRVPTAGPTRSRSLHSHSGVSRRGDGDGIYRLS